MKSVLKEKEELTYGYTKLLQKCNDIFKTIQVKKYLIDNSNKILLIKGTK